MRLIQFYLDEDAMGSGLVIALRSQGVTVLTVSEVKLLRVADRDQLAFAAGRGVVLYSFNMADYCRLHEEWLQDGRGHAGIVLARQKVHSIGEQMRRLMRIRVALSADQMINRIEFLTTWG